MSSKPGHHTSGATRACASCLRIHSGQTQDACAAPAIILQKKIQKDAESFTSTAKLNAVSENVSFLL